MRDVDFSPKYLYLDRIYESGAYTVYRTRTPQDAGYIVCPADQSIDETTNPADYQILHNWFDVFFMLYQMMRHTQKMEAGS